MADQAFGSPPFLFRVLSTAAWLDYVATYNFGPITPTRVVAHHTYRPTEGEWRGIVSMRGLQRYYASLGWSAAPHIFVAPDGIWLATPMSEVGIHAGSGNSGFENGRFWYSIGVEMVGDFDQSRPTGPVWQQARAVYGGLSRRLGIAPRQLISIHRDYTNEKSCPGWSVTKPWIWGEVEAWLAGTTPEPPPPPPPPPEPPSTAVLRDALRNEQFRQRADGYNADWTFHQVAVSQGLGAPMHRGGRLFLDGAEWNFQAFAADTLFNLVPQWGEAQRLSTLLGGSIPPDGLGRMLLDATFRSGEGAFNPASSFHLFAMSSSLGPPLGPENTLSLSGTPVRYQVFALDTLYTQPDSPDETLLLSDLAGAVTGQPYALRESLLAATYRQAGFTYHPEWAFHQTARALGLGAPLSESYRLRVGTTDYALQVYTDEVLYCVVPRWADVQRLSKLGQQQTRRAIFSIASLQPPPLDTRVVQQAPQAAATLSRYGSRVTAIVLHGDRGPAAATLAALGEIGAERSVHYYLDAAGTALQLAPDQLATRHSGLALWQGVRRAMNRISIGVLLERPTGSSSRAQQETLAAMIALLRERHALPADAVVRWNDLAPGQGDRLADLTLPRS